jgi:hypothetical protein
MAIVLWLRSTTAGALIGALCVTAHAQKPSVNSLREAQLTVQPGVLVAGPVTAVPISIDFDDNLGPLDSGFVDLSFNSPGFGTGELTFDLIGYLTVDGANAEADSFFLSINGLDYLDALFRMGGGGGNVIDFIRPGVTIVSTVNNGPGLGGLTQLSALFSIQPGVNTIRFRYLMVGAGLADEAWGFRNAQLRGSVDLPPPAPTCAFTFSKGSGASLVKYCLSAEGTMIELEAPAAQEHIGNGEIWEGYVVCSGTSALAWDLTGSASGFGPTTVLSGPTAAKVALRRESDQFRLDQAFAFESKEKDVTITMTLTNISGAAIPDVRIARAYDPDIDNGAVGVEVKSVRGVWAGGANAVTLTGTAWTSATDTAVGTATAPACSPAGASTPASTGDATLANVTYRVGNMASGAKKKVTFVYRMQ